MPTLIKSQGGRMVLANDAFTHVDDEQEIPPGEVILSLARFQAEGDRLLSEGRAVGVRLVPGEEVEALAYDLPRIALVALQFPKFLDGRHYSNAHIPPTDLDGAPTWRPIPAPGRNPGRSKKCRLH